MIEVAEVPERKAISLLMDQNTRDILEGRYGLFAEVLSWFKVIALFKQTEKERMIERQPSPGDLQYPPGADFHSNC
jgi:hypothetical protein